MNSIFKSLMGSLGGCPYAPRSKQIPAPVVAAGASVLGSVINGIFGSSAQSSANETNMEIARMNNEQAYKMFQEQNAYNEQMWNKQNAYNDPSAQVQRLLAAGINPAAVFGNGSVAQAGSLQSAQAPSLQQAHVNPYMPNFGVGEAVNAYMQSQQMNAQRDLLKAQEKNVNADTVHTELANQFDKDSMLDRLNQLHSLAKHGGALAEIAESELSYMRDSYYWRMKSLRQDITLKEDEHQEMMEKIYNHKLTNGLAEVQLAYAPKLNDAQLQQYYATVNQLKAQIGLINANKMLTDEQRKHEIEKKAGTIIQNGLSGIDFENKQATQNAMIDLILNQSDQSYYDAGNAAKFFYGGEVGRRMPLTGFMDSDKYTRRVEYRQRPYQSPRK